MVRMVVGAILWGALVVGLPMLAGGALAGHCNGDVLAMEAGGETLYVEQRPMGSSDHLLVVYVESNGRAGLQSGADHIIEPEFPFTLVHLFKDACLHEDPDTLLFGVQSVP